VFSFSNQPYELTALTRDLACALDGQEVLIPAPTGVSPAAATEQEHNENNDQDGFHVSLTSQGNPLGWPCFPVIIILEATEMDICAL
jgi:hypothetical protein